ncbi:hypothetical protein [Streptomyces sp. NPDC001135]
MSSRIMDAPESVPPLRAATGVVDGDGLGVEDAVRLADGAAHPVPGADAPRPAEHSWNAARPTAATRRVHGRSTGVGAHRNAARQTPRACGAYRHDPADRPLTDDVTAAAALLDRFTDIWRGSAS